MSHSANNITTHRLHPSPATVKTDEEWAIHIGPLSGFLFITGPGATAMQRVSRKPTEHYIALARNAVIRLNQTHREDFSAGPGEIRAVLLEFGWEENS